MHLLDPAIIVHLYMNGFSRLWRTRVRWSDRSISLWRWKDKKGYKDIKWVKAQVKSIKKGSTKFLFPLCETVGKENILDNFTPTLYKETYLNTWPQTPWQANLQLSQTDSSQVKSILKGKGQKKKLTLRKKLTKMNIEGGA